MKKAFSAAFRSANLGIFGRNLSSKQSQIVIKVELVTGVHVITGVQQVLMRLER